MSLHLKLKTTTNDNRPIYITGNFNDWKTQDPKYQLYKISEGQYGYTFIDIASLPNSLEYKYVRGDWGAEELNTYGETVVNRKADIGNYIVNDYVPHWEKNGLYYEPKFLPEIKVLNEQFEIPQLSKTRKVTILLPYNYHQTHKHYPVLYLQDGQNLYDENAPFGNWGIDKKLATLMEQGKGDLIVVAIDHGEKERITEYIPIENLELGIGKGEGTKYVEFMRDTLKPYIDSHFRTLTDKNNTGVGGSSMGGLISLYAGLYAPEVFGKLLVFSPSLWIYPDIYKEITTKYQISGTKIYIYAGEKESETMIPKVNLLRKVLESQKERNNEVKLITNAEGTHTEACWRAEFGQAVDWLFE